MTNLPHNSTSLLLATSLALALAGCPSTSLTPGGETNSTDCQKSASVSNPMGHLHGAACGAPGDCRYGICTSNALQLGADHSMAVCTKDCSCGAGSQCDVDNAAGMLFTCIKAPAGAGSECALLCNSDADCQNVNPGTICANSGLYSDLFQSASKGVCISAGAH